MRLADVLEGALGGAAAGQLCAPIGLSEEGDPLMLDLKQAAEGGLGPHGLIVGATGSGKSELLRTIVGQPGRLASDRGAVLRVRRLQGRRRVRRARGAPTPAGMITNLQHDLSLIDRMHAALFGEQQRRQSILRAAGNLDDVGAYRALQASDPTFRRSRTCC